MRAALLVGAALLAGCALGPPREAHRYFVLEPPPASRTQPVSGVLAEPTIAAGFYDTQDIVYSRAPGTRGYYHFNHWTERPQRALFAHLASRFGHGTPAPCLILRTRLEEIYHDAVERPGRAVVVLSASLHRAGSGEPVAGRVFRHDEPAASYDAPGAVQGFRRALGRLLDAVASWAASEKARACRAPG